MRPFCSVRPPQLGRATLQRSKHLQSRTPLYARAQANPKPRLPVPFSSFTSPLPPLNSKSLSSSSTTTPEPKLPEFGPETSPWDHVQNIFADLRYYNHTKWGWVIYRCTYGDDAAWERFKEIITSQTRKDLEERSHVPREVIDGMEWTFVSDPATLDGISRDQLRRRFRTWADKARMTEHPAAYPISQLKWGNYIKSPRYKMFVQVDEAAMRSVLDADPYDYMDTGWVNLVRADELMDPGLSVQVLPEEYPDEFADEGKVDSEEEDEGWMMIASDLIGPDFYDAVGSMDEYWYVYYTPPPNWVIYS